MDGAQRSCFILRHLFESFLCSVKGPLRDFHFIPESVFVFFPPSTFQKKGMPSAFCAYNQHHRNISLAPSTLWLTIPAATGPCIPACLSFFQLPLDFFTPDLSRQKYSHISRMCCSFPIIFQKPSTMRLFLHKLIPLPLCQWFCSQRLVVTLLA